jgi:hypothetical protein
LKVPEPIDDPTVDFTTFQNASSDRRYVLRVFPKEVVPSRIRYVDLFAGNSVVWSGYAFGAVASRTVTDDGRALVVTFGDLLDLDTEGPSASSANHWCISSISTSGTSTKLGQIPLAFGGIDAGYQASVRGTVTALGSSRVLLWYRTPKREATTWNLYDLASDTIVYSRTYERSTANIGTPLNAAFGAIQLSDMKSHLVIGRYLRFGPRNDDALSLLLLDAQGNATEIEPEVGTVAGTCEIGVVCSWNAVRSRCLTITVNERTVVVSHQSSDGRCRIANWTSQHEIEIPTPPTSVR